MTGPSSGRQIHPVPVRSSKRSTLPNPMQPLGHKCSSDGSEPKPTDAASKTNGCNPLVSRQVCWKRPDRQRRDPRSASQPPFNALRRISGEPVNGTMSKWFKKTTIPYLFTPTPTSKTVTHPYRLEACIPLPAEHSTPSVPLPRTPTDSRFRHDRVCHGPVPRQIEYAR